MNWSDLFNNVQKFFSCFSCCYKRQIDKNKEIKKAVTFSLPKDRFYYSTYTNVVVNNKSYPVYKCYGDSQKQYIKVNNVYMEL
jgi:hypothetical protein